VYFWIGEESTGGVSVNVVALELYRKEFQSMTWLMATRDARKLHASLLGRDCGWPHALLIKSKDLVGWTTKKMR
jgi:hypothetical protein